MESLMIRLLGAWCRDGLRLLLMRFPMTDIPSDCCGDHGGFFGMAALLHHHSGLLHAGSQLRQLFLDEFDYQAVQPVNAVLLHIMGCLQALARSSGI